MMLRSKAGSPSCSLSVWRSPLLTLWRSGHMSISSPLVHFLFQEHAGRVRLMVNKNEGLEAHACINNLSRCF
ncbi:hypothetical protein NQZ68_001811 [Dissostichus eleginoides]|nr:hypothetical protein NQZ68_001811 [Dissostichus eleginoides]